MADSFGKFTLAGRKAPFERRANVLVLRVTMSGVKT